ncbi:DNA polymerase delta subunit 3 isoform X1 [Clupea harengus]|uniref:DNA polymerase delta subunit 3 n=1 Tax=Clupea harengus TaxID=7950 RepID=A0A6P8GP29_CLUHA|nr:DNA polymerase delta subunit 3 isoform X1 [Clupea harengus]
MDELYLDNIDEYIHDQNQIVTYKWLSLSLGVHVNLAKQMLYHYLDRCRKDGSKTPLHATYLVSGKCVQNGSLCHKVSVVREDKLEDMKTRMDPTISIHVYSIQKAEIKDSSTLYSTDYDAVRDNLKHCNKYSAIHCAAAVPMSPTELELIQEIQQTSSPEKVSKSGLTGHASVAKANVKKSQGIMGMFANKNTAKNQGSNIEVKLEKKDDAPSVETLESKPAGMASAVNNFFGKPTKKQDKCIKKEAESSAQSSTVESKHPKDAELPSKSDDVKEKALKDSKAKREKKDVRSKSKRPELTDSEDEKTESSNKKKRRRIKKPRSDSSDDDEAAIADSPAKPTTVTTGSPESQVKEESLPTLEVFPEGKKRKRRRVLKSKTSVDEEGCIVTEKVYESESYSENDEVVTSQPKRSVLPVPGKKEEGRKSAKRQASNKSSKQVSIMGFFQKK